MTLLTSGSELLTNPITDLKILVASTPKTGNTWLKYLLATIYQIQMKDLELDYSANQGRALGDTWVAHQHFDPEPAIVDWVKKDKIITVTTIRHPGDMLVSMYNYVRARPVSLSYFGPIVQDVMKNPEPIGKKIQQLELSQHGRDFLAHELEISLKWKELGLTLVVRYEDLWKDPVNTLTQLTGQIVPVDPDVIERAIDFCNINLIRKQWGADTNLIRQGGIGGWIENLPANIIEMLRDEEPFRTISAKLGYNFNPDDPIFVSPAPQRTFVNPFREVTHFENGVEIPPVLIRLYLTVPSSQSKKWWPVAQVDKDQSFFNWVNEAAYPGPLLVSNLAAYIYKTRPDVQASFSNLNGEADRLGFIEWFLGSGPTEYKLDEAFLKPLADSRRNWSNQVVTTKHGLPLTRFAQHIYDSRPDVQTSFPELSSLKDRVDYISWFIQQVPQEYPLTDPEVIKVVQDHFLEWSAAPYQSDQYPDNLPVITAYAHYLYQSRPDLQAAFPDVLGQQRLEFLDWLWLQFPVEYPKLGTFLYSPLMQSFLEWATAPDPADPRPANAPLLTNYATYLYKRRSDVQANLPDIYGTDRWGFIEWLLAYGKREHKVPHSFLKPILLSWAELPD